MHAPDPLEISGVQPALDGLACEALVAQQYWRDPDDDRFELTPITQEALALALEDCAIWLRWEAAFQAGKIDARTHPALPEDRVRHATVKDALARALASSAAPRVVARAEFRVAAPAPDLPPGVLRPLEVH